MIPSDTCTWHLSERANFSRCSRAWSTRLRRLRSTRGNATPESSGGKWEQFAKDIDPQFQATADPAVTAARDYLLAHPPRKQILRDGALALVDTAANLQHSQTERLLLMVEFKSQEPTKEKRLRRCFDVSPTILGTP